MTILAGRGRHRRWLPALSLIAAAALLAAAPSEPGSLPTTDGTLAFDNLSAQIAGLERLQRQRPVPSNMVKLAELLSLRARIGGRLADYDRLRELAEDAAARFPGRPETHVLRAKAEASMHRFRTAATAVEAAEAAGLGRFEADTMRASIHQAVGRYDEALTIRVRQRREAPGLATISALAALHAARGEIDRAGELFERALERHRDVSPFPIAALRFEQGLMWMAEEQWPRARMHLEAAWNLLPSFAPARGHLAEVEAELGNRERAIELLRPLAQGSDDPDYAAHLARILASGGEMEEAEVWRQKATARYAELLARHPHAFADHAAELYLAAGRDPRQALHWARVNLEEVRTPRAYELALRAARAADPEAVVELCRAAIAAQRFSRSLRALCSPS